jgi:hypothetical protein
MWAGPTGGANLDSDKARSNASNAAVMDGNLRHALMEFYIKTYVKKNLEMSRVEFMSIIRKDKFQDLLDFLDRKNSQFPADLELHTRRMAHRLGMVIGELGKLLGDTFGTLVGAEAELDIGGKSIPLNESFVVHRGEIDAVFIFEKDKQKRVVIVDWKRTLGEFSAAFYSTQLSTYARCLINEPSFLGIESLREENVVKLLVEVGSDDADDFNLQIIKHSSDQFESSLREAHDNISNPQPTAGAHCSSRCPHAFDAKNFCRAFISNADYKFSLNNDEFWKMREYADTIRFRMVQVKVVERVLLLPSKRNIVPFIANGGTKTMILTHLKRDVEVQPGDELRVEGLIRRISKDDVQVQCTNILNFRE